MQNMFIIEYTTAGEGASRQSASNSFRAEPH